MKIGRYKTEHCVVYASQPPAREILEQIERRMEGNEALVLGTAPFLAGGFIDPRTMRCDCPHSCAFAVSRTALQKTGRMDRRLGTAAAAELAARIRRAGGKVELAQDILLPLSEKQAGDRTDQLLDAILLQIKYAPRGRKMQVLRLWKQAFFKQDPALGEHSRKTMLLRLPGFALRAVSVLLSGAGGNDMEMPDLLREAQLRGSYTLPGESPREWPLVSVVIRTRHRPEVLRKTLESLRFLAYKPLELIVIEDGEPQARQMIEREFSDLSIRYRATIKNIGRAAAANLGFSMANGKYINLLDDDDFLYPEHLRAGVQTAENTGADMVFLQSLALETETVSTYPYRFEIKAVHFMNFPRIDPFTMVESCKSPDNGVLFRRALYEKVGGMREELGANEDWSLWLRYMTSAKWVVVPYATCCFVNPAAQKEKQAREQAYQPYEGMQLDDPMLRYRTSPAQMAGYFAGVIADLHCLLTLGKLPEELEKLAAKHKVTPQDRDLLRAYDEFAAAADATQTAEYTALEFYRFYRGCLAHFLSLPASERERELRKLYAKTSGKDAAQ